MTTPITFTYDNSVPNGPNNPSVDQPNMLINTESISGIIAVDHVGFNSISPNGGGRHSQVTFNDNLQFTPSFSGNLSMAYTSPGTAQSSPQLFWQNSGATFLISAVRAFCTFTNANGSITPNNAVNISSINSSGGTITITLSGNSVSSSGGTVATILMNCRSGTSFNYSYSSGVITIMGNAASAIGVIFDVIVLQI